MTRSLSSAPPSRSRWSGRVLVLLGVVLVALNLRTAVTSISPLWQDVDRAVGLGPTGIGLLGMVPTAMFAFWGIVTPALLRRTGLERSAVLAMGAAALGQVVRAVAVDPWVVGVGSVVALSGMGIGNVIAPPLVKKYFPELVPTVSMMYITGLQAGTVAPALLAVPVAEAAGWRVSVGWWAAPAVIAAVPWLLTMRDREADRDPAGAGPTTARPRPWRSPVGVAMALFFGTNSLATYAFFTWLPEIAQSIGMSRAEGGVALAVYSGFGLIAALVVPWIAGRVVDPYVVVVVSVAAYLLGFAGLLWAPEVAPWVWIVLLGVGPSTFPLCLTLINLRTRTGEGSAALSGFSQGIGYSAACLGPVLFGYLFSRGGLVWGFAFLTGVLAVMCVVARGACRPRMLEDTLR